jgi:hypothetical protein
MEGNAVDVATAIAIVLGSTFGKHVCADLTTERGVTPLSKLSYASRTRNSVVEFAKGNLRLFPFTAPSVAGHRN